MKRLTLLLSFVFFSLTILAQEPGNNLGKTIPELKRAFPDLVEWGGQGELKHYKSPENEILFRTKKGIVVIEFTLFEGQNEYLRDLFNALVSSFSKGTNKLLWSGDKNSVSMFYSYFYVFISYSPYRNVSISYELYQDYWPK